METWGNLALASPSLALALPQKLLYFPAVVRAWVLLLGHRLVALCKTLADTINQ